MLQYYDALKFYCLILFTGIFVYYWRHGRVFYYGSKFDGPFSWPIFGNALEFAGKTESVIEIVGKWMERYKSPARIYIGNTLFLSISKPEHSQIILNSPHALGKPDVHSFAKVFVGEGLATAPVHKWKRTRKFMQPVFNLRMLNGFVEVFSKRSEILTKKLESKANKGYFDIYPYMYQTTLAMLCETNLGVNLDDDSKGHVYREALEEVSKIVFKRMISVWLSFDVLFKLSSFSKRLTKYVRSVVEFANIVVLERRQLLKHSNIDAEFDYIPRRQTFLDRMIELSKQESELFTDQQIVDEVTTMAVAGTESSALTLSYALVMLGIHQDIQEKVYEELQRVFKNHDRPIVHEDLADLPYLECVIKETLRLFPSVPMFMRKVVQDIDIGSHVVPKDSVCVFTNYYIHRDPELWEDPLKFDPDRFLPENVAKRHPYSYLPFSAGPRNCIGFAYAMYAIKSTLSTVLRKYQVFTSYKSAQDIKLKVNLILKTEKGHNITLKERSIN